MAATNPRYENISSTLYWVSIGAMIVSLGATLLGYEIVWAGALLLGFGTLFGALYMARRP